MDSRVGQCPPTRHRVFGRKNTFQAVYTSVTRAGDKPLVLADRVKRLERGNDVSYVRPHLGNALESVGPLNGNHSQLSSLCKGDVEVLSDATHPCQIFVPIGAVDRKSTRLNSSHVAISYAVFCLKKKNSINTI